MNSVKSNNLSLKYQRFTRSNYKDIEVYIFDYVPKTQFLCIIIKWVTSSKRVKLSLPSSNLLALVSNQQVIYKLTLLLGLQSFIHLLLILISSETPFNGM